jgi:hypothetical protein
MITNRWIARSQHFYRWLLRLYPQAYRATYEMEMFRVFTNQCQEAYQHQGWLGILLLWPRTLVDLGVTIVHEHITDPKAKVGLLEPSPHSPLPWKGVLLVLIPGLIFFVSQIAQLTTDTDWFFIAFYRAAYYLIVPVLLIWLLTRRFPVWGLMPLGLLYRLIKSYPPHQILSHIPFLHRLKQADPFDPSSPMIDLNYAIPLAACLLLLGTIIGYMTRHQRLQRVVWKWIAVFGLLVVVQIIFQTYRVVDWQDGSWSTVLTNSISRYYLAQFPASYLYDWLPFLLLVFVGALFAPRYGELSFLLLLGYLLPTVVFGRYGEWNDALPFALVSSALLVYRFVVALVAPIWLVRAASISKRQRAAAIPVAVALLTHIVLKLLAFLASTTGTGYRPTPFDFAVIIWDQLILAAGLGLAVAFYIQKEEATFPPSALVPVTE